MAKYTPPGKGKQDKDNRNNDDSDDAASEDKSNRKENRNRREIDQSGILEYLIRNGLLDNINFNLTFEQLLEIIEKFG